MQKIFVSVLAQSMSMELKIQLNPHASVIEYIYFKINCDDSVLTLYKFSQNREYTKLDNKVKYLFNS
jgi:hypothetical protein